MARNTNKPRSLTGLAWERLRKNRLALFGGGMIILAALIAVLGSYVRPDPTEHANDQSLSLSRKKPGFTATMLNVTKNKEVEEAFFWERLFFGGKDLSYRAYPIHDLYFRGTDIVVEEFTGRNEETSGKEIPFHLADVVYPIDVNNQYRRDGDTLSFYVAGEGKVFRTISSLRQQVLREHVTRKTYWLGTDKFGRDLLSRLMAGTVVSLSVGTISVLISLLLGVTLGAIAGFFKGWVDDLIMYLINVVWSIPSLLFVIAIVLALGKGFSQVFIAVGLTMWVEVARVVRGQVFSVREKEFIEAGKALGYSSFRLILRHVVPNVMGPVIVISAANFATAILIEAGLSYLGIGAQIPTASWGSMIKNHYTYITSDMAYLAILPGICIMLLVMAFMLVGNGLRDALDTKAVDDINTGGT